MTDMNDAEPTNVDIFNLVVAVIFTELYNSFPIPTPITSQWLAEKVLTEERYWRPDDLRGEGAREETVEGHGYDLIAFHGISWLTQCGFMIQSPDNKKKYVLSPKGFEALAAVPTSLSAKETRSLGKQLASAAATVGDRASTAVISNIIGQVIGAAARTLITHGLPGL
jgi:hypothetical protein